MHWDFGRLWLKVRLWFWNKHWKHSTLWISWKTMFLGGKHSLNMSSVFSWTMVSLFSEKCSCSEFSRKALRYLCFEIVENKRMENGAKLIQILRLHNNKIKQKEVFLLFFNVHFLRLFSVTITWHRLFHEIRCLFLISSWVVCNYLTSAAISLWQPLARTISLLSMQPLAMTRTIVLQMY